MNGTRNTDRNARKFITVRDDVLWEKIDEIMTLPAYRKSFNKVINDALFYGLDELRKHLFGVQELSEEENTDMKILCGTPADTGEFYGQVVRLLKEIIINETLNKSMLSSLFNVKSAELDGSKPDAIKFDEGLYRDIPEYLANYELRALRDLRK